jgi:FkbM family methyltransferase
VSDPADAAPLRLPRHRQRHERAYGLDGLDLKLAQHLKHRGGFFVEAGANDGVAQSNTMLLARSRGWRGLLVEPVPELADRCRRHRPDSTVVQAALVAPDHAAPTVAMRYANLMSLVPGAQGSADADAQHVARGEQLQGVTSYELEVPARTLSAILDAHAVRHVDLLSLDLEGYEVPALRGLDLARHRPDFILVEAWDRPGVEALLGERYEVLAELSHHDVLYRRRARATRRWLRRGRPAR